MFALTEDQQDLRDAAAQAARAILGGTLKEDDEAERFRPEYIKALGEAGLCGVQTPEEHGGLGLGYHDYAIVLEEIAKVNASYGVAVAVTGLPQVILSQYGTEEQRLRHAVRHRRVPHEVAGEPAEERAQAVGAVAKVLRKDPSDRTDARDHRSHAEAPAGDLV